MDGTPWRIIKLYLWSSRIPLHFIEIHRLQGKHRIGQTYCASLPVSQKSTREKNKPPVVSYLDKIIIFLKIVVLLPIYHFLPRNSIVISVHNFYLVSVYFQINKFIIRYACKSIIKVQLTLVTMDIITLQ